jgi:hypothetical protein
MRRRGGNGDRLVRRLPPVEALRIREAREFKGGLNTFDTPLNLSTKYLTELRNLYPDTNGRLRLRYGTSMFVDTDAIIDEIVGLEFYNNALIVVGKNGKIVSVTSDGTITLRWDTAIAAALPGTPDAWSTDLTFISFAQFGGSLILCNGVDKPLIMDELYAVNYLADLGTGSNTNVPRAKYCVTHNNYLILAVEPDEASTLFISMRGTSGTYEGDPGVDNDGVNFLTNTYVNRGSPAITGLGSFRDKLIVSFSETLLAITLGNYDESSPPAHIPRVDDVIENHGSISHRCIVPLGDDILFLDKGGMASVQRALITATLSPVRESTLIGTDMQNAMAPLNPAQLEDSTFAIHDRIAQHIMFFIPKSATITSDTDNNVFVYCFDRSQKFRAWSYFDQMAYRCGARTAEGRIFLSKGTEVYYYHNQYEQLYSDYSVPGNQRWDTNQYWADGTGWDAPADTESTVIAGRIGAPVGEAIPYAFSLPWSDMQSPGRIKLSKYMAVSAEGTGSYTVQMYVDELIQPELTMTFQMTTVPTNTELVARPGNNSQLYAWPQKFEKMRMRISGSSNAYIGFVGVQLMYLQGSIRR